MGSFDVEKILQQMTLEEKAQMCSGRDFWRTQDVERLGIPKVMMCDDQNGLRKQIGGAMHWESMRVSRQYAIRRLRRLQPHLTQSCCGNWGKFWERNVRRNMSACCWDREST